MSYATPTPAVGIFAKLGIAVDGATTATIPFDFNSETLGVRETFIDYQGLRGTRSHGANRVRAASRLVTGNILVTPTAAELANWLPFITGGTPSGTSYPLAEALPPFFCQILRGATLFNYTHNRIARATFQSRKGIPVQLSLDVLGVDESQPGGSFPSLTLDATTSYFIHEDSYQAVTVNGTSIDCFDLAITIDNAVQPRLVNSPTATVVYTTDRIVSWRLEVPWGDAETLYALAQGGVAASAVFTYANTSLTFTSPKLQIPRRSPDVEGRDEIRNVLEGVARYSATPGDEIAIVLDSTP